MVKIDILSGAYPISMADMFDWLEENMSPVTIGSRASGEEADKGEFEHHFYMGSERWVYHFARTQLLPALADSHLYCQIYGDPAAITQGQPEMYNMAMYFEFPHDADAVHFKLALYGKK